MNEIGHKVSKKDLNLVQVDWLDAMSDDNTWQELDELRKKNTEQEEVFKHTLIEVKAGYQEAAGNLETVLAEKERANSALESRLKHQEEQHNITIKKEKELRASQLMMNEENINLKNKLTRTEEVLNETKTKENT